MIQDEEDLLQILNDQNKIPRSSNRRSSILKIGISETMKRNSRRVSWAQTFQFQELRSDGTSVISSQELNKYGPQLGPKSLEIDVLSCNNENAPPNSQVGSNANDNNVTPCSNIENLTEMQKLDDEINSRLMEKARSKLQNHKSFTRVLSKYYDKEDKEDYQTVVNTAVNRLGIDIDPATTELFDPTKKPPINNENLTKFLEHFHEQQQLVVPISTEPVPQVAKPVDLQRFNISPIGEARSEIYSIKHNSSGLDENLYNNCYNSTKIGSDQPSLLEFWKNKSNENNLINDENDEDNHTVHETTMIIVDSSDSDNMDIDMENKTIETSPSSSQDDNDTDDVGGLFKPMLQENEQCSDTAQFSFEIEPATTDKNPQPLSMNNQHEKVEQIKPIQLESTRRQDLTTDFNSNKLSSMSMSLITLSSIDKENSTTKASGAGTAAMELTNNIDISNSENVQDDDGEEIGLFKPMLKQNVKSSDTIKFSFGKDIGTSQTRNKSEDSQQFASLAVNNQLEKVEKIKPIQLESTRRQDLTTDFNSNKLSSMSMSLITLSSIDKENSTTKASVAGTAAMELTNNIDISNSENVQDDDGEEIGLFKPMLKQNVISSDTIKFSFGKDIGTSQTQGKPENSQLILSSFAEFDFKVNPSLKPKEVDSFEFSFESNKPASPPLCSKESIMVQENVEPIENSLNRKCDMHSFQMSAPSLMMSIKDVSFEMSTLKEQQPTTSSMMNDDDENFINKHVITTIEEVHESLIEELQSIDVNVEIHEITKNDEMETETNDQSEMTYDSTKPLLLGKSVDTILNEEGIEFGNSIDKSGVQENTKINESKSVSVATESTDKKIPSPPMKRPYDFTLMNALLPETKKVSKQINRSLMSFRASTNLNMTTSPLSKASISLANNKTINRRIETTSIPLNVSKQTFNAKTSIVNQNVKNCIELNFNNSQNENQNLDTSLQNVDTLIKKCVRKSCGFDLTEKLRMKSKQLIEERKQCDKSKHETQNHATNVKDSNDIKICFDSNAEPEKNLTLTVNMESVVNNSDNAKNNEEAEESPLDISNISNLDILQNSIEFNDSDFKTDSKEDNKSDSSLLELEKMFESIGSIGARSRRMSSNSLDETVFEKTFSNELKNLNLSFVNEIVDQTSILSSFSTDSFSSKLDYYEISKNRALKRFNARTSNHPIYHSISNLDYKAIHIRIYSLDSNEFIIRFLWGTVEVRINFNDDCEPIRPMSINIVSLLNQKPIQYEEMRGLYNDQNRPLFDGDDMFLRFEEKHRPILQMGHDYILRHFHERYPQLTKMYANSNRLLELLTELSSIANTARSLTNEVRDIYSAVITELLPSVEDKFSLSIKFLGAYVDTNVDMVISFVPYNYPDEVIHPVIIVPEGEEELYEMENFKAELLNVKNGELHYLYRLVNAAHSYIIRIRNKIRQQHRLEKQKKEFAATKTLQSD